MAHQRPSGLLALPAELRNEIYELAFANNNPEDRENLLSPSPPSPALLTVCRQIYREAKDMYQDARIKYWSRSVFVVENFEDLLCMSITGLFNTSTTKFLDNIRDAEIELIKHVILPGGAIDKPSDAGDWDCVLNLELSNGVWKETATPGSTIEPPESLVFLAEPPNSWIRASLHDFADCRYWLVRTEELRQEEQEANEKLARRQELSRWELMVARAYCLYWHQHYY